jgi:rubrerythrin
MDFTNPYIGTDRKRLEQRQLAQAIRLDMAAELDAINLYTTHIDSTDDPLIKAMIQHIVDEEKEHLAEFEQILFRLDQLQHEKVDEAQHEMEERKKAA